MSETKTLWLSRGEGRHGEFWLWRVRPTQRGNGWVASSQEALTDEVVTSLSADDVATFCANPPAPGECLPVTLTVGDAGCACGHQRTVHNERGCFQGMCKCTGYRSTPTPDTVECKCSCHDRAALALAVCSKCGPYAPCRLPRRAPPKECDHSWVLSGGPMLVCHHCKTAENPPPGAPAPPDDAEEVRPLRLLHLERAADDSVVVLRRYETRDGVAHCVKGTNLSQDESMIVFGACPGPGEVVDLEVHGVDRWNKDNGQITFTAHVPRPPAPAEVQADRVEGGAAIARVSVLESVIQDLLLSADSGWYENRGGHDWPEAVDAAAVALGFDAKFWTISDIDEMPDPTRTPPPVTTEGESDAE